MGRLPDDPRLTGLTRAIRAAGGRPVLVGGAVRDPLLGREVKDMDIEVFGLSMESLLAALERVGRVCAVGKTFGVFKLRLGETEIDVSLPRREKKIGSGHRGFEIDYDPFLSFEIAASRRDFTVNAMGLDLVSGELLDPWGGERDLRAGVIRHVSPAFDEDPLRVLRACQFAARFGFSIAPETVARCRALRTELPTLSTERIWEEMKKLLLKSPKPSLGMAALETTGALSLFPELEMRPATFARRNRALDACAALCREESLVDSEALPLLLATLCRELRSADSATEVKPTGRRTRRLPQTPASALLDRMGCPISLAERVMPLLREQSTAQELWEANRSRPVADGAVRRLALRAPIRSLCRLAAAECRAAELGGEPGDCPWSLWLEKRAETLDVLYGPPQPILQGRDLQNLGILPGPAMGTWLKAAFEAQLDGAFADAQGGIDWIVRNCPELSKPSI